jgi:tetratricopeptide (TPR) repeat protein
MKKNYLLSLLFISFLLLVQPLPTGIAFAASNEKELFVVAQRAFEDGFYDVSLRYVNQLLTEFPATPKLVDAKLLEGQCYFFKKECVKAFGVFKDLTARNEYKDVSLFWLGETYLKSGDFPKAQEQYRQIIEGFPASLYTPQAYYSLAWSYFQKGDYELAKKEFQGLIEKYPSNNLSEDGAFKLGECDYNAGQYEGAVFHFNKYVQDHPQSTRLYEAQFNVAEAYYYLEQYDKSLEAYQKAKTLTKDARSLMAAMIGMGWSHMKLSKFDDALKAFDEAQVSAKAANIPEDDILLGKASLFTSQEKFKDAAASYTDLVTRFPDSPRVAESYLGRANAYYLSNDYVNAVNDYKQIISLYEALPAQAKVIEKARFGLAWTYLKSGDLPGSIASFQTVVDKTDNRAVKVSALTQIADAYQETAQIDKAIDVYDKILKHMPDTPYSDHVQYRLGVALLKAARFDPAIFAFQALKANYPKSKYLTESQYYLGVTYFKKRDWTSTVDVMAGFVKAVPAVTEFAAEARYILALSYFNLRQFDKAIPAFNEIQKLYPNETAMMQNVQVGLAKTYYEMGDFKEALPRFKDTAARYPKTQAELESLLWLGEHSLSTGAYQSAVDQYMQALGNMPQSDKRGLIHFELGRAYQGLDQLDKALEHLRQVDAQADPLLYPKAKLAIAAIFAKDLDPAKAVETYRNIITTSPEFKRDALVKIAQLYRKQRQYKEELDAYQQAFDADKGQSEQTSAQIQFAMGDVLEMLNQPDQAAEAYFKIPYVYGKETAWTVKAYLRIGKIYENKEDWDKAVAAYKKVVDMGVAESKFATERTAWIQNRRNKKSLEMLQ